MRKEVISAINFLCSGCQSEDLKVERAVRVTDGSIYFVFICVPCGATNNVDLAAIMESLYMVPFADGGNLVN